MCCVKFLLAYSSYYILVSEELNIVSTVWDLVEIWSKSLKRTWMSMITGVFFKEIYPCVSVSKRLHLLSMRQNWDIIMGPYKMFLLESSLKKNQTHIPFSGPNVKTPSETNIYQTGKQTVSWAQWWCQQRRKD